MNDLDKMLAEQIKKAVQDAVAEATLEKSFDRSGVGSRNVVGGLRELTLESDPVNYLLKRSKEVKDVDGWTDEEKAVMGGIWHRYITTGMVSMGDER